MATTSTTSSGGVSLSGLASGMDWTSIIQELLTAESAPLTLMQGQQTKIQQKQAAYQTIGTDLTTLQGDIKTLSSSSFFQSRTTSVSNSLVASASASSGTPVGSYTFYVKQLATQASQLGTAAAGKLNSSNDVSSLVLSSAGFSTPITAGTFTVNGQAITVATSDTLQSVFDKIHTATGVTGSYDSTTDEISLSGTGTVVLGNATDTSNFLQATELYNNGASTVSSASALGGINLSSTLQNANFATTVTDGGSGSGQFLINGVAINYSATGDTVTSILQKINASAAGVTATYDSLNNRFQLTNKTTGDVGVTLQDVTGNFLAASGISSGTLQRGNNMQYSINNGGLQTSQSNTVSAALSGIAGLSLTAQSSGTTLVTVAPDTQTISNTVSQFVSDYNAVQQYMQSQVATSTSATGVVTPGPLTGDFEVENIMTKLRQLVGANPGSTGVEGLNDLGVTTNGSDNTLSFSNTSSLASAITNNLAAVQSLFTDPNTGIATTLNKYITSTSGINGSLTSAQSGLTQQSNSVAQSITALQKKISNDQTSLTAEFTAMETAINSINTEKQYLNSYFNASSASSQSAPQAAGSSSSSSG